MQEKNTSPSHSRGTGQSIPESPFKGKTGLTRLRNALKYSLDGLRTGFQGEEAFRQEIWLSLPLFTVTFFLPITGGEQALLIASIFLVLITELLNSAIEATVDRVGLEHHDLSKRAKDIGSAAVFLAILNVVAVWLCVLLSK